MLLTVIASITLLDFIDRGVPLGTPCAEIRQLETARADVDVVLPAENVLVRHVDPDIRINYFCSTSPWIMAVGIRGLSEEEAVSQIQQVKAHYVSAGCAPGVDLIDPSPSQGLSRWWADRDRRLKTPRYAAWLTESQMRVVSAIRFPMRSDTFEIGVMVGEPFTWPYPLPDVTDAACF